MAEYIDVIKEIDVLSCCLIGEYDDNGIYKIKPEIAKNLVETTKVITSYTESFLDCYALVGDYTINFTVKFFVDNEKSVRHAGLYLKESYKFMGKKFDVETFLANYSDYDDTFFLDKLREVFNIRTKDESEGKDIKNSIPELEELKKNKKELYKAIVAELGDANKRYVMEVLARLKTSNALGTVIRAQLKEEIPKLKSKKGTPEYWAEIKKALDSLLLKNKPEHEDEYKKLLEDINNKYTQVYEKIQKDTAKKVKKAIEEKKKKEVKKKEADDYKPYYPKVDMGKGVFKINFKPKEKENKKEQEKPKVAQKTNIPAQTIERPAPEPQPIERPEPVSVLEAQAQLFCDKYEAILEQITLTQSLIEPQMEETISVTIVETEITQTTQVIAQEKDNDMGPEQILM
ncbi:MAG: hypothetical protein IJA69_04940 [Clostridia bacterium]|nr:hypothetical protein [Clostridia bacterium]